MIEIEDHIFLQEKKNKSYYAFLQFRIQITSKSNLFRIMTAIKQLAPFLH